MSAPAPPPMRDQSASELARIFGLPMAPLGSPIPKDVLAEIPRVVARDHMVLPLGYSNKHLRVAMSEPTDSETIQLLQFLTGRSLLIEVASEADLVRKIEASYEFLSGDEDFAALEAAAIEASFEQRDKIRNAQESETLFNAKPVVRLVSNILLEALHRHASDIHIRPGEKDVELIFRIDGDLIPVHRFPRKLLPGVVGRIKVLSLMDITEHRLPQDGQLRIGMDQKAIDVRISILPSIEGESVVMRLLSARVGMQGVDAIGLSPFDTQHLKDALDRSHGMLLVTGPTSSGKSTTLYAAINAVMHQNVNIITVENPVEFHIPGITQIPINDEIGMTFAKALRNILRHDPDVIMVGEIRDKETARITVESAQTGHLVLSTLHTNSATSTISRLIEMGIESYLLRATLLGVLAQRLVKRNCPHCLVPEVVDPHVRELLGVGTNEEFFCGAGCDECGDTGILGRRMTYEYMVATPALRKLIVTGVDEATLQEQALRDGMIPLTQHAISLARAREIPLQEAYMTRLE